MRWLFLVTLVGCGRVSFHDLPDASAPGDSDATAPSCVTAFSGTGTQTCVLRDTDDELLCKGANLTGEVGDGTLMQRDGLVMVFADVVAVGTGEGHTCAIRDDGTTHCWGFNDAGQVGDGTMMNRRLPTSISAAPAFVQIAPGRNHTCARTADGDVWCWGTNSSGMLGTGDFTASTSPRQSVGIDDALHVVVHDYVTCALRDGGLVSCWGAAAGVGDGQTTTNRQSPTAIALPAPAIDIAGGCHVHTCALLDDGSVWCWGENTAGELGDGTQIDRSAPVQVIGLPTDIVEVDNGAFHSCARTSTGDVWCWGGNDVGQITGTMGIRPTPVMRLPFVANVDELAVGCRHTCVRSGAQVTCWGMYEGTAAVLPPTALAVPGC